MNQEWRIASGKIYFVMTTKMTWHWQCWMSLDFVLSALSSQLWSFSHSDSTVTRHHSSAAQNLSRLCKLGAIENKLHQYYISSTVLQLVLRVTNVCLLSLEKTVCYLFFLLLLNNKIVMYCFITNGSQKFSDLQTLLIAHVCAKWLLCAVRILKDAVLNNNK